jgi:hypothetical protein
MDYLEKSSDQTETISRKRLAPTLTPSMNRPAGWKEKGLRSPASRGETTYQVLVHANRLESEA